MFKKTIAVGPLEPVASWVTGGAVVARPRRGSLMLPHQLRAAGHTPEVVALFNIRRGVAKGLRNAIAALIGGRQLLKSTRTARGLVCNIFLVSIARCKYHHWSGVSTCHMTFVFPRVISGASLNAGNSTKKSDLGVDFPPLHSFSSPSPSDHDR